MLQERADLMKTIHSKNEHWKYQDLRKHAIYSVLKVGDRIPMIIAITLKSPDYLFKNKPKIIKQVPFLSKDNSVL